MDAAGPWHTPAPSFQSTFLSPTLRTHRFLVHDAAKLLVDAAAAGGVGHEYAVGAHVAAARSPANLLASLQSSRRFQDLVSTVAQQKARQSYDWQGRGRGPHAALCVVHAFATLRQHARAQQRDVHMLIRSLAAWRRQQLMQHLLLWQRVVVERRFDALASSFDMWRRCADAAAHTHLLEERLAALTPTLRLSPLLRYMQWWSFISDITRAVRLSRLASSLWALQNGAHTRAWTRAAKRRALCFSNALSLTRSFHHWNACAANFRWPQFRLHPFSPTYSASVLRACRCYVALCLSALYILSADIQHTSDHGARQEHTC